MWKERLIGVYCIENKTTHKKYIGQSIHIKERWSRHRRKLKKGNHENIHLQNAWNKYGKDDFIFYILEQCSINELDEKETYYINYYDSINPNNGYNMKTGGQDGSSQITQEVHDRISKGLRKSYQENSTLKELRRNNALNQWSNPEIKSKIMGENNGMYGKTHTESARKKISEAQKGHISPFRNTTPVLCVELNKVFSCACEAAKELGIHNSILEVCYGNRHTCGGYHWKFATENNI